MFIFIYGQDSFRGKEKVKEFKDKFFREVDDTGSSLTYIDGKETNIKEVNSKVGASSLFSRKRMVIIENIFLNPDKEALEKLYNYFRELGKTSENIILFFSPEIKKVKKKKTANVILVDPRGKEKALTKNASKLFKFLDSQQYVQEYDPFSNTDLVKWIIDRAKEKGGSITSQAARALAGLVGNDLWQLNNEVNKLAHYQMEDDTFKIDIDDVQQLVKANFDENIFALTDALSNKDKKTALRILEEQYEAGSSDSYLLSMSIWQFKVLLQIRQALDSGYSSYKISSSLGLHPFVVQKGSNQVRRFSLEELKKFFSKLVEADYQLKTGKQEAKLMLNLLIVSL